MALVTVKGYMVEKVFLPKLFLYVASYDYRIHLQLQDDIGACLSRNVCLSIQSMHSGSISFS
jgi:hypothetical protein